MKVNTMVNPVFIGYLNVIERHSNMKIKIISKGEHVQSELIQ